MKYKRNFVYHFILEVAASHLQEKIDKGWIFFLFESRKNEVLIGSEISWEGK